jgi:hypothetical protein
VAVRTRRRATGAATTVYTGPYAQLVNSSARRNGLDPWLLAALLSVESGFRPDARSSAGAVGIAQILLSAHPNVSEAEAQDPAFAIPWAARYLAELKRHAGGSATGALRAYNTGSSKPSPAGNSYASRVLAARTKAKRAGHAVVASALSLTAGYAGVDQGVDFTGKGAIPALAAGRVTDVGSSGIIEGGSYPYVVYQLTSGPYKGRHVYVAENFTPTVKVGQTVQAGQPIGIAKGSYPGIEIGFNKAAKGWDPQAPLYPNPHGPKAAGQQMLAYLKSLAHAVPAAGGGGTVHAVPVSLGGDIKGAAGAVGGAIAGQVTGPYDAAKGLFGAAKGAVGTAEAVGSLAEKVLTDPGYIVLWVGFFVVGLAFLFLGIERLLGRSAVRDAGGVGKGLAVVAAPEAAPVMVGA